MGRHNVAQTIEGFVGNALDNAKISPLHIRVVALIAAGYFFDVIDLIVLGSLIPLAVPFLQAGTGVDPIGFIAAMAVASTIVDVSPFSTNGALVVANAPEAEREKVLRQLLIYSGIVVAIGPVIAWLVLVVPGWG